MPAFELFPGCTMITMDSPDDVTTLHCEIAAAVGEPVPGAAPVTLPDINTYQELDFVPAYVAPEWSEPDQHGRRSIVNRDVLKWSHKNAPPAIGSRVVITINAIGPAIVRGYFVQHGFLGLMAQPESPPEWYVKQNKGNVPGHVFGSEFAPAEIHEFGFTGTAYDACQCDETIRDGETLLIESEGVVGLAWTWPIAVTVEPGKLHQIAKDGDALALLKDAGISPMQARLAVAVAMASGFRIDPAFEQFLHIPTYASAIVQRMMREAREVGEGHHISVMGVTCQWQRDGAFVWGRYGVVGNVTREDAAAYILTLLEA